MAHRSAARTAAIAMATMLLALLGSATHGFAAASPAPAPALHLPHPFPRGYFEYTATPGAVIADTVMVTNVGKAAGVFLLYASDGATSPATGVVYAPHQNPFPDGPGGNGEYGAGAWIRLSASSTRLVAGASTKLPFSLTVPPGTHPGDWVGSVSAENTVGTRPGGSGVGLNVVDRTTIAVVIHVPGPVDTTSVVVGTPYITTGAGGQILNIPLEYNGDVLLKPVMHFTITDAGGHLLARFDGQYDTFMPHTTLLYGYPLGATVLGPGSYGFTGTFGNSSDPQSFARQFTVSQAQVPTPPPDHAAGNASPATSSTPAWLIPAVILAPVLVVLLLLLLLLARRRCAHCRHRRLRLIKVTDHDEIAGCAPCRALAKERRNVRLCPDCFRDHVKVGVRATAGV